MSRWFRFYDTVVDDPKVQRLSDDTFKAWVNLLCIASQNGGVLPSIPDIAFKLRITEEQTSDLLNTFFKLQLLDTTEPDDAPMGYTPHNWSNRQYKSDVSTDRVKRFRERERNVSPQQSETPPEQSRTETETDSEQRESVRTREAVPAVLQADWQPTEPNVESAHDAGLTDDEIDKLARKFVAYYRARGEKRADWSEQWKSWCLDEGAKKPKAVPDEPPKDVDYRKAVAFFAKTGRWFKGIGPEPGQPGCRAPPELLKDLKGIGAMQ